MIMAGYEYEHKLPFRNVYFTEKMMEKIEKEMMEAAKELDFERATELRDILFEMKME